MPRTLILSLVSALLAGALLAPSAGAALRVGIGDQKPETFSDPAFRALNVKRTRYILPWNAATTDREALDRFHAWYRAAGRREIVIAFNHARSDACPNRPCVLPSVRAYTRAFRAFQRRYPRIRIYQPWNEANSRTQPTFRTSGARRVAAYQAVINRYCRRCVVGPDVQDLNNAYSWIRVYLRSVRTRPNFVGLHNYTDVNRFRTSGTDRFIRTVRPLRVWLTETGGLYSQTLFDGRVTFRPDERRQARAYTHLLRIANKHRRSIDRIYLYNWSTIPGQRFDSAIIGPNGERRQAYDVLRRSYRRFIR